MNFLDPTEIGALHVALDDEYRGWVCEGRPA